MVYFPCMEQKKEHEQSIAEINGELSAGKQVVAELRPLPPEQAGGEPQEKVDAVTSATLKNTLCIPQIPVMMPPLPPVAKDKK